MLDHIAGRPSSGWKRAQAILVTGLMVLLLKRKETPRLFTKLNERLSQYPPWKIITGSLLFLHLMKNTFLLLFLNAPEPLSRMYTHSFYRTTWILTSLDAGFFTAMNIKPKCIRDMASILFSLIYLFNSEAAENKVRKFRECSTIEIMRVSWEKQLNPYIRLLSYFHRGFITVMNDIVISRPQTPSPTSFPNKVLPPINARIYCSKPLDEIKSIRKVVFQVPGGGFVSMNPKCHDEYTCLWAKKLNGIPIISIDYGKAPEYPYPWALEEVFDAYRSIVETNGECIGLTGWYEKDGLGNNVGPKRQRIQIIFVGDSAGGNLAVGTVFKCLNNVMKVPPPSGLLLLYPCLSLDMECWMKSSQMTVLKEATKGDQEDTSLNDLVETKSKLSLDNPLASFREAPREINVLKGQVDRSKSWYLVLYNFLFSQKSHKRREIPTELSMTSRMTFFNDRIIQPEVLRAMALFYLGSSPQHPLRLNSDYYLSPVLAPLELLEKFPPTYFMTGEKDPFVDDTMIFSTKLRQARNTDRNMGRVQILEGVSHAFMQFLSIYPLAGQAIELTSEWMKEMFGESSDGFGGLDEDYLMHKRRHELLQKHI